MAAPSPFPPGEILAPPLQRVVEPVTDGTDVPLSFDAMHKELLESYITFNGFGSFLVDIYDRWITNDFKTFIQNERIFLNNGTGNTYVGFRSIDISKPKFPNGADLLPWQATQNDLTYANSVSFEIYEFRLLENGDIEPTGETVHMKDNFSIPCMIMSQYCHYHDQRMAEPERRRELLKEMNEDSFSPGGWFIVEGSAKVLIIQEMLRQNRLILISLGKDAIPVVRMLVSTRRSTVLIQLNVGKSSNYKFQFSALGKVVRKDKPKAGEEAKPGGEEVSGGKTEKNRYHSINAYILVKYLLKKSQFNLDQGMVDTELRNYIVNILTSNGMDTLDESIFQITALIIMVSNREKAKRIMTKLIPTIAKYFGKNTTDPLTYMGEKIKRSMISAYQIKKSRKTRKGKKKDESEKKEPEAAPDPSSSELNARVDKMIEDEFYPQLNKVGDDLKYWYKAMMGVIMMAMMAEYQAGLREINDKNGWDVKQLESGGVLMKRLFQAAWRHYLNQFIIKKGDKITSITNVAPELLVMGSGITDTFSLAFKTGRWGVPKVHMRENVAQNAGHADRAEFFSQLTKVDVEAPRQGAQEAIREIQQTQIGFIDLWETPEGDSCGLLKNLTVLASISVDGGDAYEDPVLHAASIMGDGIFSFFPKPGMTTKFMMNGKFAGFCQGDVVLKRLWNLRRSNPGYAQVGLSMFIDSHNYLMVYTDGSRPIRPLLVVDDDGIARIAKHPELIGRSFYDLMMHGCVEYIDPAEQDNYRTLIATDLSVLAAAKKEMENLLASQAEIEEQMRELRASGRSVMRVFSGSREQFVQLKALEQRANHIRTLIDNKRKIKYTHCEINVGASLASLVTSFLTYYNTTTGARNVFAAAMKKGPVGPDIKAMTKTSGKFKLIQGASRPFIETQTSGPAGYHEFPTSFNLKVLVAPFDAYGMEDSFIINKRTIDSGKLRWLHILTFKATFRNQGGVTESLEKPVLNTLREQELYKHLVPKDKTLPSGLKVYAGTPYVGAYLKEGMAVIGKVKRIDLGGGNVKVENESVELSLTNEGIVHRVYVYKDDSYTLVVVKIRSMRVPLIGDKAQIGSQSQKATIGLIVAPEDLPFGPGGEVPDIIFNPHAVISRMTLGVMREILMGTAGSLIGKVYDASPFRDYRPAEEEARRILLANGYSPSGVMRFKSGKTGQVIQALVYYGTSVVTLLKHIVGPGGKIQIRVTGQVKEETRQAPRGKKGAVRFGEMEFWSLVSHGATFNVNERGCTLSDAFVIVVCKKCYTPSLPSFADREYKCPFCGIKSRITSREEGVNSNFGKTTVPYSLYLLIRLTAALGFYLGFLFSKGKNQLGLMQATLPSGEEIESDEPLEEEMVEEVDDDTSSMFLFEEQP